MHQRRDEYKPRKRAHASNEHPLRDDEVACALSYIPSDSRDLWVRIAMAVKAALGDGGFEIWDAWSRTADSYDAADAWDVWKSIGPGRIGTGTLIHIARHYGWRPNEKAREFTPSRSPAPATPHRDTGAYGLRLWLAADPSDDVVGAHPYAIRKGIRWAAGAARGKASGKVIGRDPDCVIVPVRDLETNKVVAVQCINSEGAKQTFGRVGGHGLLLGNTLDPSLPWYVCEGWASTVSVVFHHLKGHGVGAVAFGKSNLEAVANRVAEAFAPDEIVILREVDQ